MKSPVTTSSARCKDCHSCIRRCPVKAIRMRDGQAAVVDERCVACGECVLSCSQNAKSVASDVPLVQSMLAENKQVVVSLAPSFPAAFADIPPARLIGALHRAGFAAVEETSVAVPEVARYYAAELEGRELPLISACCPVVVNLVEIYYPELMPCLSTSLSPMQLHARYLRRRFPEAEVVFIGPCVGKKQEAARDTEGSVSAVLTFNQLEELLDNLGVDLQGGASAELDSGQAIARQYPLAGGIVQAAEIEKGDGTGIIAVDGLEQCMDALEDIRAGRLKPRFVEALACKGGCIGGPGMPADVSIATRRVKVIDYASRASSEDISPCLAEPALKPEKRSYHNRQFKEDMPSEEEIRAILAQIGKHTPADETNCGGCGYRACREKAIAVHQGLAEIEMCIPYMRARIESIAQVVLETTRNAIIVVDSDMYIQTFNPAAHRMFNRHNRVARGQKLACFIDPSLFEKVWESQDSVVEERVVYEQYGLVTRQTIYPLKEYQLVVGVITDITAEEKRRQADDQIYDETLEKASQVIHRQMHVAQEIAGLLGETTADTKATLLELVNLMKERSRHQ